MLFHTRLSLFVFLSLSLEQLFKAATILYIYNVYLIFADYVLNRAEGASPPLFFSPPAYTGVRAFFCVFLSSDFPQLASTYPLFARAADATPKRERER